MLGRLIRVVDAREVLDLPAPGAGVQPDPLPLNVAGWIGVLNPEQMAVMRRMFYMVGVEGQSLCAIQKQLSEDGVPSPTGKMEPRKA